MTEHTAAGINIHRVRLKNRERPASLVFAGRRSADWRLEFTVADARKPRIH